MIVRVYVNGAVVTARNFAYDRCHKIYLLESPAEEAQAKECGYAILPIDRLADAYETSCELRFINNWSLTKTYAGQFEDAAIELGEE